MSNEMFLFLTLHQSEIHLEYIYCQAVPVSAFHTQVRVALAIATSIIGLQ